MKKIISLIVVSILICTFCSCGTENNKDLSSITAAADGVTSGVTTSEIASDILSSNATSTEEEAPISSTSSEPKTSSKHNSSVSGKTNSSSSKTSTSSKKSDSSKTTSKNTSSEKTSFALGTVKDGKYINRFAKISCELGSDWVFLSDEQIRENNKLALDLRDKNYVEQLKNVETFTDMLATNVNQMDTVVVTFEKLSGVYRNFTEQEYLSKSKTSTKNALKSIGLENVVLSIGKSKFAGVKRYHHNISAKYNDIPVYYQIVNVKCEDYMAVIVACTWQTNSCDEILNCFKAIK